MACSDLVNSPGKGSVHLRRPWLGSARGQRPFNVSDFTRGLVWARSLRAHTGKDREPWSWFRCFGARIGVEP